MRRSTTYNINLSLDEQRTPYRQCECAAGMGPYAHCKYIRAAFLPLIYCGCECAAGMGPYAHCKYIRAAFLPLIYCGCECAAGMGPYAYCKYIRAAFLPLIDYGCGKAMKLELTCTETVQSFHLHNGSPVRAEHSHMSMNKTNFIFNPMPQAYSKITFTRVSKATINCAASSSVNTVLILSCKHVCI